MTSTVSTLSSNLAEQRALWRRQASSLPALRGGKRIWFPLILELVEQIGAGTTVDMEARPAIPASVFTQETRKAGASPLVEPVTWREYSRFLRSAGIAQTDGGQVILTSAGLAFRSDPVPERLGSIMLERYRLLAEALSFIAESPATIEELDSYLRDRYETVWKSLGGTRARADWLEALSLIEGTGGRRWKITAVGETLLSQCTIVDPQAIATRLTDAEPIAEAPDEIENLLRELSAAERTHESRSTYNIWVPSPASNPNKVENLRTIVNAAVDPIDREELLAFIADTFALRRSSVDSMMPFLRASGLMHEIGLGVYQATAPARAWVESGDDINFIRILHARMRFVGEMLRTVEPDVTRADMYSEAAKFGLNTDKSRWIASFLEDTGLIEQPRHGSLRTTPFGLALLAELPLAEPPSLEDQERKHSDSQARVAREVLPSHTAKLVKLSQTPQALNQGSGKAFENATRDAFRALGFHADTVSGAGDTDIVVRWRDETDTEVVAIVEAKSRSNGHVTHTDISDVALETHKGQHQASFAAVVGPAFSGDTIKNMAAKRKWALVDAPRLGRIVEAADELGLGPETTGLLFKVPNGLDELDREIERRRRKLSVVSFVISQLAEEAADTGDAITARDVTRDGRRTDLRPTIDEVLEALASVTSTAVGAIHVVHRHDDMKFSTYGLGDVRSAALRLRALADAIELSLPKASSD